MTQNSQCKHAKQMLIWRMFISSSINAAIHLGPNYLSNSEIYKSTKFEEIAGVFNICQKLVMEDSEEILTEMFGLLITVLSENSIIP